METSDDTIQALDFGLLHTHDCNRFSNKVRHLLISAIETGHLESISRWWWIGIPLIKFPETHDIMFILIAHFSIELPFRRHLGTKSKGVWIGACYSIINVIFLFSVIWIFRFKLLPSMTFYYWNNMINRISIVTLRHLYRSSFKQPSFGCHICDTIIKNSKLPWIDEDIYRRNRIRPCILQEGCVNANAKGPDVSAKYMEEHG